MTHNQKNQKLYFILKRIFDVIFAIVLLMCTSPILIVVSILIKLEDVGGPIFFKQKRIGLNNKEFLVYKFRSMVVAIEKNGKQLTDTERMLKIGNFIRKFSFDELPQIFNIIGGSMSFIGPRPLPTIYLPYYTTDELHRHDMKPGISGWAQINGRNFLTWDEKFILDLFYINNFNLFLDLKIFLLTIKKILLRSDTGTRGIEIPDVSLHEIREKREVN